MPVTTQLRLVIEFLNPQAEYRFKHFYKQQELKLDLGNCEIFTARLVSMEEYTPPREIDITEDHHPIHEPIVVNIPSSVDSEDGWKVHLEFVGTDYTEHYSVAKSTYSDFLREMNERHPEIDLTALIGKDGDDLYFITAKDLSTYMLENGIEPLSLYDTLKA